MEKQGIKGLFREAGARKPILVHGVFTPGAGWVNAAPGMEGPLERPLRPGLLRGRNTSDREAGQPHLLPYISVASVNSRRPSSPA